MAEQLDVRNRHGFGLLGVSIGCLVVALVLSKTQFEFSDLTWPISLVCQLLFGYQIVRFFGVAFDSPEARTLTAAILAMFFYSFSYQALLLMLSPNVTWVVCHFAMVAAALAFDRQRQGLLDSTSIRKRCAYGFSYQALTHLGGTLCILGTSAQWTLLLPLGIGTVIAGWLSSSKSARPSPRLAFLTLLVGGALSSGWSWYIGRLARGYWWVTSNDFQTAVSMAVGLSRFGMWDDNRLAGVPNKYHWSISGWAGMTNPWSHPETEVGVFTMLLLGFGLFLAINAWVLRIIGPGSRSGVLPLGGICAAVGSSVLSISWASQQTVFGLMAFGCFGLVFADAVTQRSPRLWVFVVLLGAAGVWSNALTLPFLAVIVLTIIAVCRLSDGRPARGHSRCSTLWLAALAAVLFALGVVFWRFLFLPSAKSGAFELAIIQSRDLLIPQLARLLPGPHLDEVRTLLIYLFVEHLETAVLFSFLLVVARESHVMLIRSAAILVGGFACMTAGFVLTGPEMGKFASWGSFMFTIALATTLAIWIPRYGMLGQSWTTNLSVAIIGVGALTVQLLSRFLLRNSGPGLHRLTLVVGGITLSLAVTAFAETLIRRGPRHLSVRLLIVSISGMLLSHLVVSIPDRVIDVRKEHTSTPTLSLDLLASREVREVSEWLKLNTDEDSIIASNYFCLVGKNCPSDTSVPISPSMWGTSSADMSNLVAYSERRFYVQAFRHIFGNDRMSELARKRVRQSLESATSGDLSSLSKAGVSYFVLDRTSAPSGRAQMSSTPRYENSRFSVFSID